MGQKCPLGRFGRVISEVSAGERHSILPIEIMEAPPKEMAWRPQIKSTLFICFYGMVLHVAGMFNRTINLRTCFVFIVVCYLVLFIYYIYCVPRCSDPMFCDHHCFHHEFEAFPIHPPGSPMDPLWIPIRDRQELGSGRLELISCSGAGSNLGSLRFIQVGIPLEDLGSSGSWQVTKELVHLGSTLGFDDS